MSKLSLNNGEKIISQAQCTAKTKFSFIQGHLYLTNKRIVFVQVTKEIFEISLDKIIEVSVAKKEWIFGCRIRQLYIMYKYGKRQQDEYIGIVNPEMWRDKIKECMTFMLMERWGE